MGREVLTDPKAPADINTHTYTPPPKWRETANSEEARRQACLEVPYQFS